MIKTLCACKKLIGGIICSLGAGIFLCAILPSWLMVIVMAVTVILLGIWCFLS